jgi:hypothetical protein
MNIKTCSVTTSRTRKQQFEQTVQILAAGDQLILQAAQRIPEERLPAFPGAAALEFVAAFQKRRESRSLPIKPNARHKPDPHHQTSLNGRLPLFHKVRVKSAEFWLRLGDADEAVRELEALPGRAWNHPSAVKVRVAALEVLGERTGMVGEEVQV